MARRGTALLLWGVPWSVFALGFITSAGVRTILWTASLSVMGAACIANATRCARVHCYFTGPFFLLFALVVVLQGTGVLPFGEDGWKGIGLIVIAGTVLLHYGTERLWGKFFARDRAGA